MQLYPAVPPPVVPQVSSGEISRGKRETGMEKAEATTRLLAKVKDVNMNVRMMSIQGQASVCIGRNECNSQKDLGFVEKIFR